MGRLRGGGHSAEEAYLREWTRSHAGVEAFVEPRTAVTETTVLLVAADGEWTRRRVAGPSFHTGGPYGYTAKGGTGVPVRTLHAVLADIAANG